MIDSPEKADAGVSSAGPAAVDEQSPGPGSSVIDPPYLHAESQSVRFWVLVGTQWVGAMISCRALHHRFRPNAIDEDPLHTYSSFQDDIHDAVRRRVAAGSLEPVMLREYDLREAPKL
ncbi:DUF1488 family protein [Ideonella sp. YS5]|uniref:DUF1488 family protein n=1 Tax=Ideonella sp. YS5 TaxID=3453714 RepID=UPI003EF07156